MLKKTVRYLAAALSLAALLTGVGCSKKTTASGAGSDTYKIGLNYITTASYAIVTLRDNSVKVIQGFGGEALAIDDEGTPDKIVTDIENLISSGCDGVIVWALTDQMFLPISELCERAKIPFVLNDKVASDPQTIAALKANPYFAGAIGPANAVYGESVADYAIAKGYKTCLVSSGDVADPTDAPRIKAFRARYEAAGGKVLAEINATLSDLQEKADNMLVAYPNPDFVYATGPDFSNAACDALAKYPAYNTVVLSSGLDRVSLDRLADPKSPLVFVNGDNWICGAYSAVVMQNFLEGKPLKDKNGGPIYFTEVMPFSVSSEQYGLFEKFFLKDFMFTTDEIKAMSQKANPEFSYDSFVKQMTSFSLEAIILNRYREGKVTDAELEAAGIAKP
jgi:ABC-type sugar transport system substrate-binding protein